MKVLVAGRSGQLAVELSRARWPNGTQVIALGRDRLDIADHDLVARSVADLDPDIIVNAAAYTAVDRAETDSLTAFAVNQMGALYLASEAAYHDIPIIHVSTDYVFSGPGQRPWREDDEPRAISIYGHSKYLGERAVQEARGQHIIIRTSWLFAAHGQNFVRTMLRLGADRDSLNVVNDQLGCPTPAADLAQAIADIAAALMAGNTCSGLYHYSGKGPVTWFEFAEAIFDLAGELVPRRPSLKPISTAEFGAPAPRPVYSVLDTGKIERDFGIATASWLPGLRSVLDDLRPAAVERASVAAEIGQQP